MPAASPDAAETPARKGAGAETILFSQAEIALRVAALAKEIARAERRPDVAAPVLMGAFVFAADLMRALSREGLDLETDFLWLRSYGKGETPGDIQVLKPPSLAVRGRSVLLIDGVLDSGATLVKAHELLLQAGATVVISAVAVAKVHPRQSFRADYAMFTAGMEFLFGYGMDRDGMGRSLPDIRVRRG